MAPHRGILAYDFERSFSQTHEANRITDAQGKERLGKDVWEAGAAAAGYLQNTAFIYPNRHRPNLSELQEAMPQLIGTLEIELDEHWLPMLTSMIDAGTLILKPSPLTKDQFVEIWKEKDFVERGHVVLQLQPILRAANLEDLDRVIDTLASISILSRIDDAVIAADLGDIDEVSASSIEIADFMRALTWQRKEGQAIEIAVKSAIKRRAQSGGHAKYKRQAEAKDFVQREWEAHKGAYGGNKSAFARDYVRRVHNELDVQVTEKTLREVWLSTPPTSKPAE